MNFLEAFDRDLCAKYNKADVEGKARILRGELRERVQAKCDVSDAVDNLVREQSALVRHLSLLGTRVEYKTVCGDIE